MQSSADVAFRRGQLVPVWGEEMANRSEAAGSLRSATDVQDRTYRGGLLDGEPATDVVGAARPFLPLSGLSITDPAQGAERVTAESVAS
jgi:hypothetical protein